MCGHAAKNKQLLVAHQNECRHVHHITIIQSITEGLCELSQIFPGTPFESIQKTWNQNVLLYATSDT